MGEFSPENLDMPESQGSRKPLTKEKVDSFLLGKTGKIYVTPEELEQFFGYGLDQGLKEDLKRYFQFHPALNGRIHLIRWAPKSKKRTF